MTRKCIWCKAEIALFGGDVLWSRQQFDLPLPLLQCIDSPLWPQVHLPVGEDGWFPSPRYWGGR